MGWFGSLDLAFKYALIFGSALALTLVLGFIKLMADRRKMKKLVRDLEAVPGRKATIDHGQSEVNMREKDEGDLFGIRAIEAGFFGGIAQSAPPSVVNSPAGSRSASPAPGIRTPQNHSPSSSITIGPSRPLTSSNQSLSKKHSGSGSTISLSQLSHDSSGPEFMQPHHLRSTSHNSGMEVRRPLGQSTLGHTYSSKLRPSQAELSGRIKHGPIDTSLDILPFAAPGNHPSPNYTAQESLRSSLNRSSDDSNATSMYQYSIDDLDESRLPMPPMLGVATDIGTSPFAVVPLSDNPHSDVKSTRASVVSRATVKDQWHPRSADTEVGSSPNLPAFPKNAIIDSSNPQFRGFVKERESKIDPTLDSGDQSSSARDLDGVLADNRRGHFSNRDSSLPPTRSAPAYDIPTTNIEDHRRSRRTSFSYSITNPDAYDPEIAAFNSRSRLGDAPMSTMNVAKFSENQNQGTYRPKGFPSSHDV